MHGLAVIHQRRHCLSMVIWRRDAFVTYLLHFRTWDVANPRTTKPFHFISCHLFMAAFQTVFKPNSNWWISSQCQVGMIWLLHLALVVGMEAFRTFSGLFTDPFLSGVIGVFLHVRCVPHQNSQRLFWASVCVCACPCVCICGCLCMTGNPRIEERPKGHTPSVGLILWFSFFSGQSALVLQRMDVSSRFQHRSLEGEQCWSWMNLEGPIPDWLEASSNIFDEIRFPESCQTVLGVPIKSRPGWTVGHQLLPFYPYRVWMEPWTAGLFFWWRGCLINGKYQRIQWFYCCCHTDS